MKSRRYRDTISVGKLDSNDTNYLKVMHKLYIEYKLVIIRFFNTNRHSNQYEIFFIKIRRVIWESLKPILKRTLKSVQPVGHLEDFGRRPYFSSRSIAVLPERNMSKSNYIS